MNFFVDTLYISHYFSSAVIVSFFVVNVDLGCTGQGDAFLVNIGGDRYYRGNYCNSPSSGVYHFVCEGI